MCITLKKYNVVVHLKKNYYIQRCSNFILDPYSGYNYQHQCSDSSYSKILTSITSSLCFMKKSDSTSSLIHSSTASITARIHCHCIFW
nr:MAG TPA: hypothetical protein [Caudoviricetes sp.]